MPASAQPLPAASSPAKPRPRLGPLVRAAGVVLLAGSVPLALGHPSGPKLIWTWMVAGVPLAFTVAGYHAWRRICPLAFFATLGQRWKRQRKAKAGEWLAAHGPEVQMGLLALALVARHLGANATPWALASLLVLVILAATAVGFLFTGKTWCNHLCPVGVVEKIYQEPLQLVTRDGNSQCATCTACKKNCPDIDLEQGYWKELDQPGRRRVYYAWPGLVGGFYAYFPLATGSWDTYFGGIWARETGLARQILGPGFQAWPWVPRLAAVPLTLLVFGALSFATFALLEPFLGRGASNPSATARHRGLALSGFVGFLLFVAFAGPPLVAGLPFWAREVAAAGLVAAATALFLARWRRSESDHVQEKFAKGLLKRWEWGETPGTTRLGDLYLMHQERTQERQARLEAYKHTVRDLLDQGVLSRATLPLLQRFRTELGISDKEHEAFLAQLSQEEKRLFDPGFQGSVEKQLQLDQYRQALERLLLDDPEGARHSPALLDSLRLAHQVTVEEHGALLTALQSEQGPLPARLRGPVDQVVALRQAERTLGAFAGRPPGSERTARARDRRLAFLQHLLRWRQRQHLERIVTLLGLVLEPSHLRALRLAVERTGPTGPQEACLLLGALEGPGGIGPTLAPLALVPDPSPDPEGALLRLAGDSSPYLRAAALALLPFLGSEASERRMREALLDPAPLVRDSAQALLGAGEVDGSTLGAMAEEGEQVLLRAAIQSLPAPPGLNQVGQATLRRRASEPLAPRAPLTTLEGLISLHGLPLLADLDPEDLEALVQTVREQTHAPGDLLCRQGERSDDVFLILRGRARIWVGGGPGQGTPVGEAGEGSCVGEMAVLDGSPRSATVVAETEMDTLVLGGSAFRSLWQRRPSVGEGVLQVLARRLRNLLQDVPSPLLP